MKVRLNSITKGIDRLSQGAGLAGAYTLLGLIGFTFVSVIMRYVFSTPIKGSDEVSRYILAFVVCIGLAYALKAGAHVRTTIIVERLPEHINRKLEIPIYLIGVVFAFVWTWSMWVLAIRDYVSGYTTFSALEVPLWIPESVAAIGFTLFLFLMISQFSRLKIK
ncbi:hypothetical protein ES703_63449 [subsurface metagenome]